VNIHRSYRLVLFAVVLAMIAAACTNSAEETTTTETLTPANLSATETTAEVEFGSGSIPETLPADFPVPEQAVIGTTLVDRARNNTEVVLTVPAGVLEAKAYFEENLPGRNFEIAKTEGTDADWVIEFTGAGGVGIINISAGGAAVSVVAVQFTTT
jgi:hypothetical protein